MERFNLLAPEVRKDPYPHYAELRRSSPVCQIEPGGMWAVTRYDDVVRVFKDTEVFSSAGLAAHATHPQIEHNPVVGSLIMQDPPAHAKTRALVTPAFTNKMIQQLEPLLRATAIKAVEELRSGEVVDFCEAMATQIPAAAICDLLGLDIVHQPKLKEWTETLEAVNPATPPELIPKILETISAMEGYVKEAIAERRKAPKDDLLSDLLAAKIDGVALTEPELVGFLFVLTIAGLETTTHLLSNSMRFLVNNPDVRDRLQKSPERIGDFIEEMLRFDPPAHATLRLTTRDTEVGGVPIPKGSIVVVLIGSATHDESKYKDSESFNLDREKQAGLAFGHGIHFCLGAALARFEARIALEELLKLQGRFEEAPAEHVWNLSLSVRGLVSYPIRYAG